MKTFNVRPLMIGLAVFACGIISYSTLVNETQKDELMLSNVEALTASEEVILDERPELYCDCWETDKDTGFKYFRGMRISKCMTYELQPPMQRIGCAVRDCPYGSGC